MSHSKYEAPEPAHLACNKNENVRIQEFTINRSARATIKKQSPKVIWFTGISGSGKSTIANLVEKKLHQSGLHTYLLDGDNIRLGLNRDLGFSIEDRVENIRRIAEVSKLMVDAGLIVLCAFISPFRSDRRLARELFTPGEFLEIFVDTPLEIAEQRDPKGLYKKARLGLIKNFTGIDSPYEEPAHPELTLRTALTSKDVLAEQVCSLISAK